jgi:hypothetical protein
MAAHARGVAYAAKAAGLAAPTDPTAVAREAQWQLRPAALGLEAAGSSGYVVTSTRCTGLSHVGVAATATPS